MKKCCICKNLKDENDFYKAKDRKDGLRTVCKICNHKKSKQYYQEKQYYQKNKKELSEKHKQYYQEHKEEIIKKKCIYQKERLRTDERFRIILNLRSALASAFKKYSTTGKIMKSKKMGIDYETIFKHIGPCPGDRSEWHIDHIIPLSAFDFDDPEQVKEAFKPENHQWLTKEENLKKGNRY